MELSSQVRIGGTGVAVWVTGLSGSGKTQICVLLEERLREVGYRVSIIDGDVIRRELWPNLGFSKEDRNENVRRIAYVAKQLVQHGVITLIGAISPYSEGRKLARAIIGNFIEVYAAAPLEVCEQRDPKGLYKRARMGAIPAFTGISSPYEPPEYPEVICHTDCETPSESVEKVISAVSHYFKPSVEKKYVNSARKLVLSDKEVTLGARRKTIAVDFDGVISNYFGWSDAEYEPRLDVIEAMRILREEGWKLIIYSCRGRKYLAEYLSKYAIPYDEINENTSYSNEGVKPVATVYWDDRALTYSGNASVDLEKIRSFRTWSGRC